MRRSIPVLALLVCFLSCGAARADEVFQAVATTVSYSTDCGAGVAACGETEWSFTGPMDFTVLDAGVLLAGANWLFDGGGITAITSGDTYRNLSYISQCSIPELVAGQCFVARLIRLDTFAAMPPSPGLGSEDWTLTVGAPPDGQLTFALDPAAADPPGDPAPVPEPATLALLGLGLVAAGWLGRKAVPA